jgi:hypothetical protein
MALVVDDGLEVSTPEKGNGAKAFTLSIGISDPDRLSSRNGRDQRSISPLAPFEPIMFRRERDLNQVNSQPRVR